MGHEAIQENDSKVFGFWIYLMTDLIIFAVLFAAYIVLRNNIYDGPSGKEILEIKLALAESLILLTSSFTCSIAMIAIHKHQKNQALFWFMVTFALGAAFLVLEFLELKHLVHIGADWSRSGFLSAFFTLIGTHGLHIFVGLLWMIVMMFRIVMRPLNHSSISRIVRMALFWHFLDFVWIFIFTIVHGIGHLL
ncbi:MAG: cytochrome c oxidase subunit 3 [Parachlamydiaceae bacterium]|nr:cytochrome c oxidase subunit 3 [Parachlamydiaceae bacterium]